jgi:hypothetical protein
MIFDKNLVKLNIVWLSEKNIGLKPWDGGSINKSLQRPGSRFEQKNYSL